MRKSILMLAVMVLPLFASADQINFGVRYDGWNLYTDKTFNGWDAYVPLSFKFRLAEGVKLYGATQYNLGSYTADSKNTYMTGFSDSLIGSELLFKLFSLPSILNVGVNLPSGNESWEAKQQSSIIPTEFVDTRYRGRGLGLSAMYGLAFPASNGQYGLAVGYQYTGSFNPSMGFGTSDIDYKAGDSLFLALNRVISYSDGPVATIRLSAFYFLTTELDGAGTFQMGPNVNASYCWSNPGGFSLELGEQIWLPSRRYSGGILITEPHYSYGPIFRLAPSYAFGDLTVAGLFKWIMANGYSEVDALYNGGGFVIGLHPDYRLALDETSAIKLSAGIDDVIAQKMGVDTSGKRTDITWWYWTFGTSYEIKL
jgi:hypothetical protein